VAQWQRDRRLNLDVNQLEKTRIEQSVRLAGLEQTVAGLNADLLVLKGQFAQTKTTLEETRQKLHTAERETVQLASERDQLKVSVTNWAAAVAVRDERLKEANSHIRRLADELNMSILRFNELATNYNAVVKDLNDLRARPAQPPAENAPSPQPPESGRPPLG
jgi:chromosome segregation ATPase